MTCGYVSHAIDPVRAGAEVDLTPEQQRLDALVFEVYGTRPKHDLRRCCSCGAVTCRPTLCGDCTAVAR